jgi:predicted RNase H-like nuclease (RuvC/YqgF family)
MRLSELEFRVRQTENYIKYADELKDLRSKGEGKKIRNKEVSAINDKIETLERRNNEHSERLLTIESKFTVMDKDLRQQLAEFEAKYVGQQLDLT